MKRILLLMIAHVLCASVWEAKAQSAAPNPFYANPAVYKHRINTMDFDLQVFKYLYTPDNRIEKEVVSDTEGNMMYEKHYTYDANGYLLKQEEYRRGNSAEEPLKLIKRDTYTRDQQGYITEIVCALLQDMDYPGVELTDMFRIKLTYDGNRRIERGEVFYYLVDGGVWEETPHICQLTYNEKGQLASYDRSQDGANIYKEEFYYDEDGRNTSVKYIPGPVSQGDVVYERSYEYDDDGDIVRTESTTGFVFTYEYDKTKLASETFVPRLTTANFFLLGSRNDAIFSALPANYGSKHAVKSEESNMDTHMTTNYVPTEATGINPAFAGTAKQINRLSIENGVLYINVGKAAIGEVVRVYDAQGISHLSAYITDADNVYNVKHLKAGVYVVKLGKESRKIIVK
ncbi:T9SS type A sorting domain-containing protein [Prevotella falsenii]|uniref:T9SS type A sorting domain-containing protein n=1 Tax=Prevotella falsenii TaxID=515414 RepID=UPI0018DC256F|nr:T9SS type A sorting domain-containing protein [Prevotella falsenii]